MKAPCYVFEGTWWKKMEVPKVLFYFRALESSHEDIALNHRTIRSIDDIEYYIKKIRKGERAFVYIACHGEGGRLYPTDWKSNIIRFDLLKALSKAKENAISFLHIGSCEFIRKDRKKDLKEIMDASKARWVSGYRGEVDWLQSTFLEMALVTELYVPFYKDQKFKSPKLKSRALSFLGNYDQLSRSLEFSGLCRDMAGINSHLIPKKLHKTG